MFVEVVMHPRLIPGNVKRTKLLERIKKARDKTCLLVHGPAGSGKTSLITQWRAMLLTLGQDVAWLSVKQQDGREDILNDLFDALDVVDPDIAREGRILYNQGSSGRLDAIALALLRAQVERSSALTLIIDDWQYTDNANDNAVLQTILDCAPQNLKIVIVSRSVPGIAFSRLRDLNAIEEIGPQDLRFSLEEIQSFIHTDHAEKCSVDARTLMEMTDGWAAGLRLVTWQPSAPSATVQNTHDFTAYFNREVLRHLDSDEIDVMCRLAAASGFNASVAMALVDDERGPMLVNRLINENLFITTQHDTVNDAWYVFHPLFREILLVRFHSLKPDEQRHTHQIFAQWFGAKRQLQDAVHHAVAAGDIDQAVMWVERWARELFLNGELQQLARSVAKIPQNALNENTSLLLWQGWTQLCYHKFSDCHSTLAKLDRHLNSSKVDRNGRAHWLLLSFSLSLQQENIRVAQAMLPDMVNLRQGGDAVLIGGRRNLLGWLYTRLGEYDKAREVLQGHAPLLENGKPLLGSAFGHIMTRSLHGLSWLFDGNVRQAEDVLRETLSQSEKSLGHFDESTCNAAAYLSAVLYEINDLDSLHNLLEGRFDTIERVVLPDALVTVSLTFARLRCSEGNPLEAIEGLERLEDIAERRSLDRLLAFALSERVRCLIQLGDLYGAETILHQLRFLANRRSGLADPISQRINGLMHYTVLLYKIALGDDKASLEHAMKDEQNLYFGRDVHGLALLKSLLISRTGYYEQALETMHPVLLQSQAFGLVRTLLDFGEPMLRLVEDCAIHYQDKDPILLYYAEQLRGHATEQSSTVNKKQAQLVESLTDREQDVLNAMAYSMSNKRIAKVLGVSPETVKWHLRNIYGKLGVAGRDDAVARARDIGLLISQKI